MSTAADTRTDKPKESAGLTRRTFMQTSAAVSSTMLLVPSTQAASTSLEGYTAAPSTTPGGVMDFYLRDPQAVGAGTTVYPMSFTRVGQPDTYMGGAQVSIGNQAVPSDASTNGCRWVRSHRLTVPADWPSGLYYAFIGSGANACTVPFVVRAATATAGVKTLICVPMLTVHAYNAYGGKSIYDYNSTNGVKATQVSLDRPFTEAFNSFFDTWTQYLVRWMAKNGQAADFCTDWDIEVTPSILAPYQLYVQAGHDEYWSNNRRNTMDGFVAAGGNCAYLGGNTAWFQSRLAPGGGVANRTLVCYKDAAADPITDPQLKTINFISLPNPRPENITTGSGFVTGCSWVGSLPRPNTPSVTMRPEHWAFAGTGLGQGAGFGGAYVGYECNSAMFSNGADQRPYPTGADRTPATTRILAAADGSNWNDLSLAAGGAGEQSGYAHITVFSNGGTGGTVFSTGSSDWAYGLIPELNGQTATPLSRITLNVINQLKARWSETADVRQYRKTLGSQWSTYYTTGTSAPANSGLSLDGYVFRAFPLAMTGTVPVYRFRSATTSAIGTRYRYSRSTSIDINWVFEAIAFHAYSGARSDATAIYEHTMTVSGVTTYLYAPGATPPAGWTAGALAFYAPNANATATVLTGPAPSFTLNASTSNVSVTQSRSATAGVTVMAMNGFTGSPTFSASGLPAGVTASFAPPSGNSTTLTLTASATAVPGTYQISIVGMAMDVSTPASVVLSLTVLAAPVPSFTLSAADGTLRLPFLGLFGGDTDITVNRQNGFTGVVTFSVSGLPSGMAVNFLPVSSTTGTDMNIYRQLLGFCSSGSYVLTVKGTSGNLSATTTVVLELPLLF